MRKIFFMLAAGAALFFLMCAAGLAAARSHYIVFGRTLGVKWFTGPEEKQARPLTIRPLFVDEKLREFTTGPQHDITDQIFVVRRVFRINDVLPDEGTNPRWKWQRDGWLEVDRETGHLSVLKLEDFDAFYSAASWYRDYIAYCGVSSDAEKFYAVVEQVGMKKPLLRKELGAFPGGDQPDSACPAPAWQRQPARVTFHPAGMQPLTFEIHGAGAGAEDAQAAATDKNKP